MLILVNPKSHSFPSTLILAVLFLTGYPSHFVFAAGEGSESATSWKQFSPILERGCHFGGFIFNPGERWVPHLGNISDNFCAICLCLEDGEYECGDGACCINTSASGKRLKPPPQPSSILSKIELSLAVSVAEDGSSCCKTCSQAPNTSENEEQQLPLLTELQGEETVEPNSASSTSDENGVSQRPQMDSNATMCFFKNNSYRDQEYFLANRTRLPDEVETNHCIKCQCKRGLVTCSSKAEKCYNNSKSLLDDADSVKNSVIIANAKNENLKSFQQFRRPWVIVKPGNFPVPTSQVKEKGRHNNSSETPTSRENTSPKDRLGLFDTYLYMRPPPVAFPGKHAGCLSEYKLHRHGSQWHPSMGPFGPAECIVCTCLNGRIECGHIGCSVPSTCDTAVKLEGQCCPVCFQGPGLLCAPSTHTITVFQSFQSDLDETGPFERISLHFVKPGAHSPIDVHEWTFSKGKIRRFYTTQYANLRQFLQYKKNAKNLVATGVTTLRNLAKFTSREEKLHKRCTSECNLRLNKFIQSSLRLQAIVVRSTCGQGERLVLA